VTEASPSSECPSEEELLAHLAAPGEQAASDKLLAHFDVCTDCRLAMAEATRAIAAVPGPANKPAPTGIRTLAVGERVLDRYEIRRFIARGGMGEVYEAIDLLLDERVALKTLASTVLDDDRAAFRFKGEVRLARRVTHANVCRILEFGVHLRRPGIDIEESVPFLTMEFLAGETLADRLRKHGPYSPEQAMPLLRQILTGLKAIHDAGIVHRDLKTENVFLVADPRGEERAVLMDFGLARAVDGSVPTTMPHRLGHMAGTIDCMAPEQIHGGIPVGPTADVFALGVLMFELLGGQRPFIRVPPGRRLTEESPRLHAVAPHLPRAWDQVVARCLQRKSEDRYQRLDDLIAALPGAEPPARQRPTLYWVAAAVAVGAIAASAFFATRG
jgi:serine/threonine protein kinase